MKNESIERLLTRMEEARLRFGPGQAQTVKALLADLGARRFTKTESVIRFHEALLFLRAFPHDAGVVRLAEKFLNSFHQRVQQLRDAGIDMDVFDDFDTSGVAGTEMQDTLSFEVARWLVRRIPGQVEIDWEDYDESRAMAEVWPELLPLLEDDAWVEADTPCREWLSAARGREDELAWLIKSFERLPCAPVDRARLFDSLRLPIRWKLDNLRFSRTRNWRRPHSIFFHREALTTRSQVSLKDELSRAKPALKRLSVGEGATVMDSIREVMAVRYRELYGTTLGDPRSVVRAEVGRGVEIYLWNLPPERRLPLRAYVAGMTLKNGVPINYVEAIGLCEWIEVGFNTFYTFRNGETAWIYAQTMRCLCQLTGARCISVYPYQIGKDNEEAIDSGAFWFYRKLGFRPGIPELLRLTEREERRIAANPKYRTPARILKKMAEGFIFYELPGSEPGAWDRFSKRGIGLRVNRMMAREYDGDAMRMRTASVEKICRALGFSPARWSTLEKRALENLAPVLALIPGLERWTAQEKTDLVEIIRSKAAANEMRYLNLTAKHARLRWHILRLGSGK